MLPSYQPPATDEPDLVFIASALVQAITQESRKREDEMVALAVRARALEAKAGTLFKTARGANALYQVGLAYRHTYKYVEAKPIMEHGIRLLEQYLGADNFGFTATLLELSILYDILGLFSKKRDALKRCVTIHKKFAHVPQMKLTELLLRSMLALTYYQLGDKQMMLYLSKQVDAEFAMVDKSSMIYTFGYMIHSHVYLFEKSLFGKGLKMITQCFHDMKRLKVDENRYIAPLQLELGFLFLHDDVNRLKEAKEIAEKGYDLVVKFWGATHMEALSAHFIMGAILFQEDPVAHKDRIKSMIDNAMIAADTVTAGRLPAFAKFCKKLFDDGKLLARNIPVEMFVQLST